MSKPTQTVDARFIAAIYSYVRLDVHGYLEALKMMSEPRYHYTAWTQCSEYLANAHEYPLKWLRSSDVWRRGSVLLQEALWHRINWLLVQRAYEAVSAVEEALRLGPPIPTWLDQGHIRTMLAILEQELKSASRVFEEVDTVAAKAPHQPEFKP